LSFRRGITLLSDSNALEEIQSPHQGSVLDDPIFRWRSDRWPIGRGRWDRIGVFFLFDFLAMTATNFRAIQTTTESVTEVRNG
jgi:hypothetical protein